MKDVPRHYYFILFQSLIISCLFLFSFQHCSDFSPELLRHLVDSWLDNLLDDGIGSPRSTRPAAVTVLLAAGSPTVSVLLLLLAPGAATVVVSPPSPSLAVSLTGVTSPILFVLPMSGPGPRPLPTFLSSSASTARSFSSLLWLLILRV